MKRPQLTSQQRNLVSQHISREWHLKNEAQRKLMQGKRLSFVERRRAARPDRQIIRIGFEKARSIDPSIPEYHLYKRRVR